MPLTVPSGLRRACAADPLRAAWLERLPTVVEELSRRWQLRLEPPYESASCAWVAPAAGPDARRVVLKIGMPHVEGEQEIAGLRFWNGDPTVRLLEGDDAANAMLLERCEPGTPLTEVSEREQDAIVASLLRRLWRRPPALHPFQPLSVMIDAWVRETSADSARWPDPSLVGDGLQLMRELARTAPSEVLLATDLHAGNVLRANREPWLVIDPKPFVGDPAYDATQHLLNHAARVRADARDTIRRFAAELQVDAGRVRQWLFARAAAEPREAWSEESLAVARALAVSG